MKQKQKQREKPIVVMLLDTSMLNLHLFERIDSDYNDKSTKKGTKTNVKVHKNA